MSREIIPTNRSECVQGHLFCGKLESVNLKFYQKYPNIGDQFSLAVAQHYFSPQVTACDESALTIPNVILIGSFLHYADACSHICGAGFIASDPKYKLRAAPKSINCVRGPLTGHLLEKQGATDPHLYADPGILAPAIYPQNAWSCGGTIGLVAHYVDAESPWIELCRKKGLKIIDVFSPPDKFFAQINQCEAILSSSLHGIIFAHAYGKPALWIELSDNIIGGGFKFYDYYMSVGVRPEKVRRVRVTENTDPCEIAKSATIEEHAKLHASLKEAMDMTIQKLKHDTPKLSDARNTSNPLVCNNTQKTDGVVKLHIACGRHYLDGWVNIDGDPKTQADIHCDITREGLPFPDNSVDYVFNEHFIEHLSYEDGLAFFKEAYRVLKSDGVLRIAFPDLRTLIDSYIHDDWREMEWVKLIDAQWYPSGCFMLNRCIREKGLHKYMYDVEEVQRRLSEAGFCSTTVCQVKQSNYPQLQQAERRADSSVVEAVKAGVPLMDDMLTVILLTYNHEATISRAFDSILEQETGFNFNIFVLEDCSTDRTAQICKDYQTKYPGKIKLFLNERNLGPAQNYKNGLLKVTAKYYAFLEGDDYWCNKKKLQKQVAALEANPDCTMAGHDTLYKDLVEHKEKTFRSMFNIGLKTKYSVHDKFRVHLSSRVYRNIIDLTKVPDFMFFDTRQYLLYLSKGKLFYIDEIMSVYNKTGTGLWSGMSECDRKRLVLDLDDKTKKYFDSLKAIEKRAELAENHDDSKLSSDKTLELFRRAQCEFEMGNMVTALQHIRQYQNNPCYDRLNPVFAETRKPKPLFSVIAVTHNRPEDVNLCIDSLRQQEFNDYEVIIVDNGDADKKAAALAGQVDVYVGCSINFNPSEARNIGAHFAKGEILVFLDDDALVGPDYLVSIQKAFKQYEILGLRGKILPKNLHELSDRVTIYDLGDKPMSSLSTIEGNTAFRRDAYLAVGGMDALLFGHEGIDLSYRLMQLSGSRSSVIYWPEATIYHDYGNANQFAEKKDRYDRNRNYLKYKYDVDVIGLKEEIQASPLKSNQSGRLLPPFPVIQQPATAVKAEVDGPKVSIVMACRNAAEFLAETMDSILAQTLKDWELLAT
ncbi:MAG: glycosyltransferase, partial [Planctomycetota bacterium]